MTTTESYGCDRHGEDAYQGCAMCELESLRSRLAAQENAARQADERGDEAMRRAHAAEARLAEAERDAARYREWKRAFREGECGLWNALCDANSDAEHDAAIDAAMAADSATHRETPVT